jgi:cytochrome b561
VCHLCCLLLVAASVLLTLATRFIPAETWPVVMRWHVPVGISILVLMIVSLVVRHRTPDPKPASAGNAILDKIGVLTHHLLYVLAILMPLAGLSLALTYGLLPIQIGAGANLLAQFGSLHRWIAFALAGLIALHIGAALYHEIIRKDNLMSRMWFEKKN